MHEIAPNRCHEGVGRLVFPDILADPLIRAIMAADHVDPIALKADLGRIASALPLRPGLDVSAGCRTGC